MWDFDTINHQTSHFNQMAAALLAIDMAHHYLGHYKKYATRTTDASGHPVPINALVSADEWQKAVLKGSRNALDCGLGIEGIKLLIDSLDQLPARPQWTACLAPATIKVAKAKKELDKLEGRFFIGAAE